MTEREKIIEIIAPIVSAHGKDEAIADALIADALIEAGYGDVKSLVDGNGVLCVKNKGFMRLYPEWDIKELKHRVEVAEKECNEWKERAERMHKEALKYKQRVSDSKHSEDTMRNQIECAMGMVSEMEHAKRTLEILYMSGAITEEALRDAVKQAKIEIEEED